DKVELDIEREIFEQIEKNKIQTATPKKESVPGEHRLAEMCEKWVAGTVRTDGFEKIKAVVDCANGAASNVAPELFRLCKLDATFTHAKPDGKNINEKCGALHPEVVAKEVVTQKAD